MTSENIAVLNSRPRIRLAGDIRSDMEAALVEMRVNLPFSGMAHAEVRLINWRANESDSEADFAFQAIAHGDRLEILAGDSNQAALFSGEITAIEETYGQGAPQLVLLAEDDLHRLAKKRNSQVFEDVSLNQLIQTLVGDEGLQTDVHVSSDTAVWHQLNESKLAFLQRILWPYNIAVRTDQGRIRVKAEEEDTEPVELHPQNNVKYLRVIADLNHQYQAAYVNGFNLDANESARADNSDPAANGGTSAKDLLQELGWAGDEILVAPFARNQAEANAWSAAAFRKNAQRFLHGDLLCNGDARLRTGKQIDLTGASARLNGKYQIMHTQHVFDQTNGYVTRIKVVRTSWNNS